MAVEVVVVRVAVLAAVGVLMVLFWSWSGGSVSGSYACPR